MSESVQNHIGNKRKVLFDIRNAVGIVSSAKRYGPEATTFQSLERNIVFSLTAEKYDKVINQNSFVENGIKFTGHWQRSDRQMTSSEIKWKLMHIAPEIKAYLMGEGSPLLPAGFGWDGKHTNIELARANRIKQLIIGETRFENITSEIIDIITEDAFVTPSKELNLDWDKAIEFDDKIYPLAGNENSQLFIFLQNDDVSTRLDIDEAEKAKDIFSIQPDAKYNRVVVIVTKYITSPNYPNYGISLELYKRRVKNDSQ